MTEYSFPGRIIRVEGTDDSECAGLWADLRQIRTGAEYRALSTTGQKWGDVVRTMAPYIVAWNIEGIEEVTETVPAVLAEDGSITEPEFVRVTLTRASVPPPAEAGPDVLIGCAAPVRYWLLARLIETLWYRADDPKSSRRLSSDTPPGPSSETSPAPKSGTSGESRRRTRKSSGSPGSAISIPSPQTSGSPRTSPSVSSSSKP